MSGPSKIQWKLVPWARPRDPGARLAGGLEVHVARSSSRRASSNWAGKCAIAASKNASFVTLSEQRLLLKALFQVVELLEAELGYPSAGSGPMLAATTRAATCGGASASVSRVIIRSPTSTSAGDGVGRRFAADISLDQSRQVPGQEFHHPLPAHDLHPDPKQGQQTE